MFNILSDILKWSAQMFYAMNGLLQTVSELTTYSTAYILKHEHNT